MCAQIYEDRHCVRSLNSFRYMEKKYCCKNYNQILDHAEFIIGTITQEKNQYPLETNILKLTNEQR